MEKKLLDKQGLNYTIQKIHNKYKDAGEPFVGKKSEWEALSDDEKAKYLEVIFIDDYSETVGDINTFIGKLSEWEALDDTLKETFAYVIITDDYSENGALVMQGATANDDGEEGLVPAPHAGDEAKFLRGDGNWGEVPDPMVFTGADGSDDGEEGLVPAPHAGDEAKFLRGDGNWGDVPDPMVFTGADGSDDGEEGLVPVPHAGDEDRVLQGNGAWGKKVQIDIVTQNGEYGYINSSNIFVPFKSQADIDAAVSAAMVGNATAADVLSGKTFTNETDSGLSGSIPTIAGGTYINSAHRDSTNGAWIYIPYGYYDKAYNNTEQWLKLTDANCVDLANKQEKTVTAGTSAIEVTPDSNKLLSKVTVGPTASFTSTTVSVKCNTNVQIGKIQLYYYELKPKTWNGLSEFWANCVWSDGDNIYWSDGDNQYILNKLTSTWSPKTWYGLTKFRGDAIWTAGNSIYASWVKNGTSYHYVLNKATSTWSTKTWNGLTKFKATYIWSDGTNIYYTDGTNDYQLNTSNSTWSPVSFNRPSNVTHMFGGQIWSDGINIYHTSDSSEPSNYILNKTTKTWSKLTSSSYIMGNGAWTDGINVYNNGKKSGGSSSAIILTNKSNFTWEPITFTLPSDVTVLNNTFLWTDGANIYYSWGTAQYVVTKTKYFT